jgi:hypothetical protein
LTTDNKQLPQHLSTDPKVFVIARRCGRLANRLVLFANIIAFAEERGHRVINFTFHSYAGLFEATRRDIYCQYPVVKSKSCLDVIPGVACAIRKTRVFYHAVRAASVLNERCPVFGRSVVTLRDNLGKDITLMDGQEVQAEIHDARIVFVYGWRFRAPDCVQRQAEKIRAYFRPIEEYESSSRHAVERLRQDADIIVGVHVRQGDYRIWRGGKCFFPILRYATWMHELAEQFPSRKVSFLVCSDEPRHEREFPQLSVGFGTGTPVGDLSALARCDYILGPTSTFSQWASFYGNKPILQLQDADARIKLTEFRVAGL